MCGVVVKKLNDNKSVKIGFFCYLVMKYKWSLMKQDSDVQQSHVFDWRRFTLTEIRKIKQ